MKTKKVIHWLASRPAGWGVQYIPSCDVDVTWAVVVELAPGSTVCITCWLSIELLTTALGLEASTTAGDVDWLLPVLVLSSVVRLKKLCCNEILYIIYIFQSCFPDINEGITPCTQCLTSNKVSECAEYYNSLCRTSNDDNKPSKCELRGLAVSSNIPVMHSKEWCDFLGWDQASSL